MLNNLSSRILTQRLDDLVDAGYVNKKIISKKPRRIRYELTDTGKELALRIRPLRQRAQTQ